MRARGLFAVGTLLASGLLLQPAGADEEACGLVQDVANDTVFLDREETSGFLVQQSVDIASADIATTEKYLHAVIRVQSLYDRSLPGTAFGWTANGSTVYRLEFASGARTMFVETDGDRTYYGPYGFYGATAGRVGGATTKIRSQMDHDANEIRFTAPLKAFGKGGIKAGEVLQGITVKAVRTYSDTGQIAPGVSGRLTVGDTANGGANYVAGTPSCIVPDPEEEFVAKPMPPRPEPKPEPTEEPTGEPTEEPTEEPSGDPSPPAPSDRV